MPMDEIALCLPKGENLDRVASFFNEAAFPIEGYTADNRTYRPVVKGLGTGRKTIYVCCHKSLEGITIEEIKQKYPIIRMVSEFPNLCEHFAITNRFRRFKVFSAWGGVEPYVPEHAELVVLAVKEKESLAVHDLVPLESILETELCMVVNQKAYETTDLSPVLSYLTYAGI